MARNVRRDSQRKSMDNGTLSIYMDGVKSASRDADPSGEKMIATKTPSVSSVRRALAIIEAVSHGKGLGVSGISRKINAPKSSTHTILLTLERSGFVRRDDHTGHYSLGLKIFDLASTGRGNTEIRDQAHPE